MFPCVVYCHYCFWVAVVIAAVILVAVEDAAATAAIIAVVAAIVINVATSLSCPQNKPRATIHKKRLPEGR